METPPLVEKSSSAMVELIEDVDEGLSGEESAQIVGALDFHLFYDQVVTS